LQRNLAGEEELFTIEKKVCRLDRSGGRVRKEGWECMEVTKEMREWVPFLQGWSEKRDGRARGA